MNFPFYRARKVNFIYNPKERKVKVLTHFPLQNLLKDQRCRNSCPVRNGLVRKLPPLHLRKMELPLYGVALSLCTSQFQKRPSPLRLPGNSGHVTRVKLRTVGNLIQNEACPVWHLTFVSKRLSAVRSKRISQFFDLAGEPRSRAIALVDSTWGFLLLSFYIVLSWNVPLFKVWSEDKLNKEFVVAEKFANWFPQFASHALRVI